MRGATAIEKQFGEEIEHGNRFVSKKEDSHPADSSGGVEAGPEHPKRIRPHRPAAVGRRRRKDGAGPAKDTETPGLH